MKHDYLHLIQLLLNKITPKQQKPLITNKKTHLKILNQLNFDFFHHQRTGEKVEEKKKRVKQQYYCQFCTNEFSSVEQVRAHQRIGHNYQAPELHPEGENELCLLVVHKELCFNLLLTF